jgi:peptidoglycan hydrolase CwlO-like protein
MTDQPSFQNSSQTSRRSRGITSAVIVVLLAVAAASTWAIYKSVPAQERQASPPNDNARAIHSLEASQQQVLDQLKALQQTVSSDQTETKRLSGEITALTGKLEALQQSFASAQAQAVSPPAPPEPPRRRRGTR